MGSYVYIYYIKYYIYYIIYIYISVLYLLLLQGILKLAVFGFCFKTAEAHDWITKPGSVGLMELMNSMDWFKGKITGNIHMA